MKFRRIALWAFIDVLGTSLGVALLSVHPPKAADGVKPPSQFLISADWPTNRDSDIDLWVQGPSGHPVMYAAREVGCAALDRDSRGALDGVVTLADGSQTQVQSYKETVQIRCIEPGRWTVAVMFYSAHDASNAPVPVHVDITGLNPQVTTLFAKDVSLDRVGQAINVISFDLDREGHLTLAEPPLEDITSRWLHQPGSAP